MSDAELTGPARYGTYYWCIKVPSTIAEDGEIYLYADQPAVQTDGSLFMIGHGGSALAFPVLILAAGSWTAVYTASVLDEAAVAVEHWKGEVLR
jgi:hypothetical protein